MKFPMALVVVYLLLISSIPSNCERIRTISCAKCAEWSRAQKPFRIYGNTYYVGTHGLSSILITSSVGHVLIDAGLPQSASQIVANMQALGFQVSDIKVIVNSHAHFDHAGGIAELQRLSGARVVASQWSANVLGSGHPRKGDPQYVGGIPMEPVANVQQLRGGQQISAGNVSMTAHITAGHTPGGTSWTWKSCESSVCRSMVYADSLTPVSSNGFHFTSSKDYPDALQDFERSFAFLETTPCDILITPHPEVSLMWERLEAREKGTTPDPFVDPGACGKLAQNGRQLLRERIAQERPKQSRDAE
jgi:metallo-beta-lactamase class B